MNTVLLTQRLYFGRPPRYIYSSNSISANSEFSFFPSVLENYTILDQRTVLFDFLLQVQLVLNTKHQPAQVVPVVVLKIHSATSPAPCSSVRWTPTLLSRTASTQESTTTWTVEKSFKPSSPRPQRRRSVGWFVAHLLYGNVSLFNQCCYSRSLICPNFTSPPTNHSRLCRCYC